MIGYASLGTNDLDKAIAFYDALLADLGATHVMEEAGRMVVYGGGAGAMLMVTKPYDGNAANVGNGTMIALACPTREAVDALYNKALSLGGTDEGAPGERGQGFYGGYFRDLDGNKLVGFKIG